MQLRQGRWHLQPVAVGLAQEAISFVGAGVGWRSGVSLCAPMLAGMRCGVCDGPLPEDARFCPACGAVVGTQLDTAERKVVTVLFADLVDSTSLSQRFDAERAREILGRFFDAATEELQALRGRPEKFIGDAVMAVFGLPTVHEDDAVRAVRAGLAIRGRLDRLCETLGLSEPLQVRIGIESGEAATGLGPAGQLLVTGNVVNVAARLQGSAHPGEVVVGETTHALTSSTMTYGDRREVTAKGFDGALAAFPVDGLSTRSARRTIPFVGRVSELAILRENLTRVGTSGQPVLATILGESGIGKSRLADELLAGLGDDVTVLVGRGRSYADTATFAPAAAMVGELAGIDEDGAADQTMGRLRSLVDRVHRGSRAEQIVERLSLLFDVAERRDASTFVHDVHAGVTALVDDLADTRAVVLIVEDAHALRPAMLELVERLGTPARTGTRRVMVIALARSELIRERPTWGSTAANAVMLRLDPLTDDESLELVRYAGGGRIADADAAVITARAGGNPFFIIESTGMLLPDGGGATSGGPGGLPPTVQAVVSARLDALSPRLRELARRAATFFVSFDLEELRVVDPGVTDDEVGQLVEAEIVVREPGARATARWRLRHSTLKDVAYSNLPKRERVRLHEDIAGWLHDRDHPTWAAEHLELAALAALDLAPDDRAVADRAADALFTAGHRARRRMENRSAIDYTHRGLALAGPDHAWGVREARALASMGEAHYWLGDYPQARSALDRAVALGDANDDAFTLALALRFLGDIAINVDADVDEADRLLARSLQNAERLDDPWSVVRTLLFAGWVPWTRRRYADAEVIWRRALELVDPDDGWARVRALNCLSINRTGGPGAPDAGTDPLGEALALSDEASALAEELGDPFSIAMTTVQRARVLQDMGRIEESLPCLDSAIAIFEDLGARWEYADAMAERGITMRELGRLDEAEDDLSRAIRVSEELGERQLASWTWRALARVSETRGDIALAEERHRRSVEAEELFTRSREPEPRKR